MSSINKIKILVLLQYSFWSERQIINIMAKKIMMMIGDKCSGKKKKVEQGKKMGECRGLKDFLLDSY